MDSMLEPVAVVGAAWQFPGLTPKVDSFWELLRRGETGIFPIVDRRPALAGQLADGPFHAGMLSEPFPAGIDASFFGLPPKEAAAMDPQQRLALELAWMTFEEAGKPPVRNRDCGVFLAISTSDYQRRLLWAQPDETNLYAATGCAFSAAAGRISNVLGLCGPSLAVDTACSSSLVAVHLACQAIHAGDCEMALVCGVNGLLEPSLFVGLSHMGLLAADGRSKPFASAADGYVRSEGGGAVLLRRLSSAQKDGDRIYAVLLSTAVNHNGGGPTLTAPNQAAQERLLRLALDRARLLPKDIDYLEAHGTGTPMGDLVELCAVASVLCEGRPDCEPLMLGSVKANIGHLEAAAGMAGLIKAIHSLEREEIPPHAYTGDVTPEIPWEELPLKIPRTPTPWRRSARPRRAGVSSFGFGGTNGHIILEEAPATVNEQAKAIANRLHLLPLSAKSPKALRELAERFAHFLSEELSEAARVCYTASVGRTHFAHRLAVTGTTTAELGSRLRAAFEGAGPILGPSACAREAMLAKAAGEYLSGGEPDWLSLYERDERLKVGLPTYPFQRQRLYIEEAAGTRPTASRTTARKTRFEWNRLRGPHLEQALRRLVAELVADIGGISPSATDEHVPLLKLGLTSLHLVELGSAVGVELAIDIRPTFLFDYPTIYAMATALAERICVPSPASSGATVTHANGSSRNLSPEADYSFLDNLEEDKLEALIDADLKTV